MKMLRVHTTNLYDIGVVKFSEEFHFSDGGHIKAVLELPDFNLLNSHLPSGGDFTTFKGMRKAEIDAIKEDHTAVNHGVSTLADFLIFGPFTKYAGPFL
jgi:hypothetical protein